MLPEAATRTKALPLPAHPGEGCKTLVWAEWHETRAGAFRRERRIKEWRRFWKLLLIEERNPTWRDMLEDYITA